MDSSTRLVSLRGEVRPFPAKRQPCPQGPAPEALLPVSRAPWGQPTRSLLLQPHLHEFRPPPLSQSLRPGTSRPILTQACPLRWGWVALLSRLTARRGGSTGPPLAGRLGLRWVTSPTSTATATPWACENTGEVRERAPQTLRCAPHPTPHASTRPFPGSPEPQGWVRTDLTAPGRASLHTGPQGLKIA